MRSKLALLICILLTFTFLGCSKSKAPEKPSDKNEITSLKVRNIRAESKEIKDETEFKRILALVDSVKILTSDVEVPDGIGYGVDVAYADGKKASLSFSGSTMIRNGTCYKIDKDISSELRDVYERN